MKRNRFARVMSLVLAISLVAGFLVGIFVVMPILVPILSAVGIAAFVYFRFIRGNASGRIGAMKWKKK